MTVGELKKRLEGYPDDMPVVVPHSSIIVEKDIIDDIIEDTEFVYENGYGIYYDGLLRNLEQGEVNIYENGDEYPDDYESHCGDPYWRLRKFTKFKVDSDCSVTVRYGHDDAVLVIGEYNYAISDLDSDIGAKLYDECLLIC